MARTSHTIVLALGGSLIVPHEGKIDKAFLRRFLAFIRSCTKQGYRFVLIIGGGKTARMYQQGSETLGAPSHTDLDAIGIAATKLNAELVRVALGGIAYERVCDNPRMRIHGKPRVIVASGWKPGCSTDYDAVLWAKRMRARTIIDAGNIAYVYDMDPVLAKKKHRKPVSIKEISWTQYRSMIDHAWSPGLSAPFDPVASKAAHRLGLSVCIIHGEDIQNMKRIITGGRCKGTIIS